MEASSGSNLPQRRERVKLEAVNRAELIKMERQLKQPDVSSVHSVLLLPELLAVIFEKLAFRSDLETLKNARLVCSLWKSCAFDTFKDNLSLRPTITVGQPQNHLNTRRTLESCAKNLQPSGGLPLKLLVNQWSSEVERFLQDFSNDIVSFTIRGIELHGFPDGLGLIRVPALENVTFSASVNCSNRYLCEQFGKALSFWKQLVSNCQNVKTCVLELEIANDGNYDNERLGHCDAVFDLVQWNKVNRLVCSDQFFEKLVATSNNFESLENLEIYGSQKLTEISLETVGNLTKLRLNVYGEFKLTQMKKLKSLTLEGGATVISEHPLPTLLPNLSEVTLVTIVEDVSHENSMESLIIDHGVFEDVARLDMTEAWETPAELTANRATMILEAFPNISRLKWTSISKSDVYIYDQYFGRDSSNKNCFIVAPVIFSMLELLTSLKLEVYIATEQEVFQLVAGITMDAIPEDEHTWTDALEGNPHSICNLKHLKQFQLDLLDAPAHVTVTAENVRFLFTAAFQKMDSLEDLRFPAIYFEDVSFVNDWKEMGRKITVFQLGDFSFDEDDDNEVTSEMDEEGDFYLGHLFDGW